MPVITRNCPLCKQKDIKYLSAHLKNKHKLVDAKERAPILKQSLNIAKCKGENEVKRKDTVLAEDESDLDEFNVQQRIISVNFQDLEDRILKLRLKALQTGYTAISEECYRLEIRAKLLPLYEMVINSLKTLLVPITQMKQADAVTSTSTQDVPVTSPTPNQVEEVPSIPKRKKKSDVRHSGGGMDYLKNGLVRCQLCKLTWDGNAQHECPYIDELVKWGTIVDACK